MKTLRTGGSLPLAFALFLICVSPNTSAWDGYNNDTGSFIEVESYDHQGEGEGEVEYFDYDSGEYRTGSLDMFPGGSGELTDYETGETYEVDMDE
jgi:hypothetical protein